MNLKKLLFVGGLLRLEANDIYRNLFVRRFKLSITNNRQTGDNQYNSPVYDLIDTITIFGLLDMLSKWIFANESVPKTKW